MPRIPQLSAKTHSPGHVPVFSLLVERKKAAEGYEKIAERGGGKPPNGTFTGSRAGERPREPLRHPAELHNCCQEPFTSIVYHLWALHQKRKKAREKTVGLWPAFHRLSARGDQPEPSCKTCSLSLESSSPAFRI
ncbi:hypothetical protein mRhiFer1_008167 [Rhinolophus ferrumequinum]|uniref:Uncharacterized protein n=1 Tax=Rhinolophus ferrumequinum TaxID=59479 RepID=A0A7J7W7K4_RHIFE|nr:hypothetical protein mRhiFer1_008167 [Rhinolophus ferrumequinum]